MVLFFLHYLLLQVFLYFFVLFRPIVFMQKMQVFFKQNFHTFKTYEKPYFKVQIIIREIIYNLEEIEGK